MLFVSGEKILITGGTGFIGSQLARKLVREDYRPVLFDIYPNLHRVSDIKDQVDIVEGSVGALADIESVMKKFDISSVFHTAAQLSVAAATEMGNAYSANITGTFNVLEACRIHNVKKVVFISSLSVFGPGTEFPFHQKSYRDPASFYGASKVCGEILGNFYGHTHDIDFRCVRLAVVIGPGRRGKGATVSFSQFVEEVVLGKTGTILVPDYTILPIIHIDDATDLLIALWKAERVESRIHMSGGVPIPIEEFVESVKKHVPDAEINFEVDPEAEQVASTWTLLTSILVDAGQEKVYREIEEIGWKLSLDTTDAIATRFVEEIQANRDLYSSI